MPMFAFPGNENQINYFGDRPSLKGNIRTRKLVQFKRIQERFWEDWHELKIPAVSAGSNCAAYL